MKHLATLALLLILALIAPASQAQIGAYTTFSIRVIDTPANTINDFTDCFLTEAAFYYLPGQTDEQNTIIATCATLVTTPGNEAIVAPGSLYFGHITVNSTHWGYPIRQCRMYMDNTWWIPGNAQNRGHSHRHITARCGGGA